MDLTLKPIETLLFSSNVVGMGQFRCPADHPLFRDSGPCTHHTFVFPRTATIIHRGGAAFTATANTVSLYNQHQEYTRSRLSAIDASDWFVLADDVLLSAMRSYDPGAAERPSTPFRHSHATIDSRTYIRQRRLFDRVSSGSVDPLEVEECALRIFDSVLASAYSNDVRPASLRDEVEAVKQTIAAAPFTNQPLRALAAATETSPFHLCRAFRRNTGVSITTFKHSLRLRASLELLRNRSSSLTDTALHLGYSSHSHFTAVFKRHFGMTPSQYRAKR